MNDLHAPNLRDLAEPNEPIYGRGDSDVLDNLYWLGPYLMHRVKTHGDIVVLIDVDKMGAWYNNATESGTSEGEEPQTWVSLDPLGVNGTDGFAVQLSIGDGFFAALHGMAPDAPNSTGMQYVDIWCAPQPSSHFELTKLSVRQEPGPHIDLRREGLVGGVDLSQTVVNPDRQCEWAISACGDRFAVLDAQGAVGLWTVDLGAGTVTKAGQLRPMNCPGHCTCPQLALGTGTDGSSVVISVWYAHRIRSLPAVALPSC